MNPHGVGPGDYDADALTAWNAEQDRARAEYDLNPITRGNVHGPGITPGCGRPTKNHTGICRTCTVAKKKSKEKP